MKKTKVYFNRKLVQNWWCPFLVPILWIDSYNDWLSFRYVDLSQLSDWCEKWKWLMVYSDIENCDFCVFPVWYKIDFFSKLELESNFAKKYNKKIIVFYESDNEIPVPNLWNLIVFRTSLRNDSPCYEYALPSFCPSVYDEDKFLNDSNLWNIVVWYVWYWWKDTKYMDFLAYIRNFLFVRKFVAFICYHCHLLVSFSNFFKNPMIVKESLAWSLLQSYTWSYFRQKSINILKKSSYKFSFYEKNRIFSPSTVSANKRDYIDILYGSTFTLVVRWYWNYAHRLYETMSAGRIPLFIDTSCRLPFENEINYEDLFLIVPFNNIDNIDVYISLYLKKHQNDIKNVEMKIRDTYEKWIKMDSFFTNIMKYISLNKIN